MEIWHDPFGSFPQVFSLSFTPHLRTPQASSWNVTFHSVVALTNIFDDNVSVSWNLDVSSHTCVFCVVHHYFTSQQNWGRLSISLVTTELNWLHEIKIPISCSTTIVVIYFVMSYNSLRVDFGLLGSNSCTEMETIIK